jgi:transcriptional regulator with XRE-family HTH domain
MAYILLRGDPIHWQTMEKTKPFGSNLRKFIRRSKYLTYQNAADAFDISISFLNQLMRGERDPSMEMLAKISKVLNVSISQLLGEPRGRSLAEMSQQELINMIDSMMLTVEDLIDRKSRQPAPRQAPHAEAEVKTGVSFPVDPKRLELLGLINRAPPELVDTLVNTVRGFLESSSEDLKSGNINGT